MPENIPVGQPCWFDVTALDIPSAADFYCQLFGWEALHLGPDAGHYTLLHSEGEQVAGIAPSLTPDGSNRPAVWIPYFSVDQADTTAKAVEDAGGSVVVEPADALGQLDYAVLGDPDGAGFAIAKLKTHPGSGHWGQFGGACWVEYSTPGEPLQAMDFYRNIFGWHVQTAAWETSTDKPYQALRAADGEREFGGVHAAQQGEPSPMWSVTFAVQDCDAIVDKCTELDGSVVNPPQDLPGPSRVAVLADPNGASFAVMAFGT